MLFIQLFILLLSNLLALFALLFSFFINIDDSVVALCLMLVSIALLAAMFNFLSDVLFRFLSALTALSAAVSGIRLFYLY